MLCRANIGIIGILISGSSHGSSERHQSHSAVVIRVCIRCLPQKLPPLLHCASLCSACSRATCTPSSVRA